MRGANFTVGQHCVTRLEDDRAERDPSGALCLMDRVVDHCIHIQPNSVRYFQGLFEYRGLLRSN